MQKLSFIPEDGIRNSVAFPDPSSENETREQMQRLHDQTKVFINNFIDLMGASGANEIGNIAIGDIPAGKLKDQLQAIYNLKIGSNNVKGIRYNEESIEYTLNGTTWESLPSNGHTIRQGNGLSLPQRKSLKFDDAEVIDDGVNTVVKAIRGLPGKDGTSFTIKGMFATYEELIAAHPTGNVGDMYNIGDTTENYMYIWNVDNQAWQNIGKMTGAKGEKGDGVAIGGTVNQVLVKNSSTNFDTKWATFYTNEQLDALLIDKATVASVTALNTNKADKTTTNAMSTRITALEGSVSTLNTNIQSQTVEMTLLAANWQGTSVPFTYALSVPEVTATSNQDITYNPNATQAQIESCQGANIVQGVQALNTINLRAFGTKPTVDIPIVIVKRGIK